MLAERWVRRGLRAPHVILRPAAVYGPRDVDFYTLFKVVRWGLMPLIDGGRQPISLVYVRDAARAVRRALESVAAQGNIYHIAHSEPRSQRQFLECIAGVMGVDPLRLRVPHVALYPVCLLQEAGARLTGRASIVNLQKIPEYAAPGWVASTAAAAEELGFVAGTDLAEGVHLTYEWYAGHGWL
jgi:nucleoside-diphosphate-sugar epimerase